MAISMTEMDDVFAVNWPPAAFVLAFRAVILMIAISRPVPNINYQ